MGKFFTCWRIWMKFRLRVRRKSSNDRGEFKLDWARFNKNIAKNLFALGHDTDSRHFRHQVILLWNDAWWFVMICKTWGLQESSDGCYYAPCFSKESDRRCTRQKVKIVNYHKYWMKINSEKCLCDGSVKDYEYLNSFTEILMIWLFHENINLLTTQGILNKIWFWNLKKWPPATGAGE